MLRRSLRARRRKEPYLFSLIELADTLSSLNGISAHDVESYCTELSRPVPQHEFLKNLRETAVAFRKEGKYGRVRAVIFIALTCEGHDALVELESSGIFLATGDDRVKFLSFLQRLSEDATKESQWTMLLNRMPTYRAYADLVEYRGDSLRILKKAARNPVRHWVKQLFCLVEIAFGRGYFHLDPPPELRALLDEFPSPEELASAVSLAVAIANEVRPLDIVDMSLPIVGPLDSSELAALLRAAHRLVAIKEISHNLSCFSYTLRWEEGHGVAVAIMTPPTPEFERSVQLGFIRGQLGKGKIAMDMMERGWTANPTLADIARYLVKQMGTKLYEIADPSTKYRRVRLHLPVSPQMTKVFDGGYYVDELEAIHGLTQDFLLPVQDNGAPSPTLTQHLDYACFRRMFRFLRFYSIVDSEVRTAIAKNDKTALQNSLIRIVPERDLHEMLATLGEPEEAIDSFLQLIAADVDGLGHYDLQYSPLIKVRKVPIPKIPHPETEYVLLPSAMITSNETRNSQIRAKTRFHKDGKAFVRVVSQALEKHFSHVVTEKKLRMGDLKTDVDIVLLCGGKLYLIECKHSLTATSPHEMRDLWRDVVKGRGQVTRAEHILSNPERRLAYVRQWFRHLSKAEVLELPVVRAVLSSHRLFSGLDEGGIAIRDYASLSRLLEDGELGIGYKGDDGVLHKKSFRIREQEELTCADIENYFSPESKFHRMQFHSMKAQDVFQKHGNLMLVRESYAFEVDTEEWLDYMRGQGYVERPDLAISVP
ncbi:MAG: hypothetical protein PW792_01640 [Acidobacteriaceae bacterium]|nr:hypothetical protein [Acidobacteriaceae bacterium]